MTPRKGVLAVLVSSVCFGFLGFFGKVGYDLGYTPLRLLTVRFVLASLMMWLIAGYRYKQQATWVYGINVSSAKWLAVQGVTYAFTALGIFNAYRHMPAGLVGVLFYIHPLLTIMAASVLWRERITSKVLASAAMAFVGAALVSQSGGASFNTTSLIGLLWILLSAAAYSAFTLIGQRTTAGLDSMVVTTYSITFCALFLVLLNPPLYMVSGALTAPMWLIGLGISFVGSVLAILLYVVGIKAVGASRTAIISAAEPVSGVLIAAALLNERLSSPQLAGMVVILISVWYLQTKALMRSSAESV